ncbi:MAG: MATE family efflux transporter [Planctomycetaceae bacterium]|jgi:putative MATE family efflux protein|nr:MATE family efflux transporter [Planctomycetaceae bacterium]
MDHAEQVRRLEQKPVGQLLWEFSIPAIAATVVNASHGIINRIFVGQTIGEVGIAAITVTFPIITIMLAFGMTIGIGANTLISIRLGEKKNQEAEQIVGLALFLFVIFAAGFMVFGLLFQEPLLKLFSTSDRVMEHAKQYLTVMVCGAFFHEMSFGVNSFLRSEGKPHTAMFTTLIMVALNILFDYLFLFVFHTDIWGAALATILAQICSTSWVFWHYISGNTLLRWRLKYFRWNSTLAKEVFLLGMPPFIMQIVTCLIQIIQLRQIMYYGDLYGKAHGFEHGGDIAVSAFGIIFVIWLLTIFPILGINQGAQPIIGYNYGAGHFSRVRKAMMLSNYAVAAFAVVSTAVLLIFPEIILSVFGNDEKMLSLACRATRISVCLLATAGPAIVMSGYFQAIGDAKTAIALTLIRQIVFLLPVLLILPYFFGLDGVWASMPVSDLLTLFITLSLLRRELKKLDNLL